MVVKWASEADHSTFEWEGGGEEISVKHDFLFQTHNAQDYWLFFAYFLLQVIIFLLLDIQVGEVAFRPGNC